MPKNSKLKIGIVGLGMVGDPIRRWFEERRGYKRGIDLFCYDTDSKKGYSDDVNKADIIFVSVPTPSNPDGSCNISIVENAISNLKDGKIIVIKSTVTPGTVEKLQKKHPKKHFLFNPEFLTETQAWLDFLKPDRQIVGFTKKSISDAKEILLLLPSAPFVRPWQLDYSTKKQVNATEAEIAKYGANVFGYLKVIYGNILADVAHALSSEFKKQKIDSGVDYENIKEIISADGRIGPAWLDVNHGNYCGAGGYCLDLNERLFAFNSEKFKIMPAKDLSGKVVAILGWKNGKVIKDKISILAKRFVDSLIKFDLSKGRSIAVTPDHLVVVSDESGNLTEKCAKNVKEGNCFPIVLDGLRGKSERIILDLYSHIDYDQERVLVERVPQSFSDKLRPYLTFYEHSDFKRKKWRAIPMKACLDAGVDISKLRIKTGTSGTWIPATIRLDGDFARFIGYYLAEGCVTDNRVLLSFSVKETDLINDVRLILNRLKIKFSARTFDWNGKPSAYTFKISSKVFSSYFLNLCGTNSYNKQIPHFIFEANREIKNGVLAGLFRGDGSIEKSNSRPGPYYTVNYATTSQILAEGVDLLLREKGILSSIKKIHTAKTKVDAWSLNISELENVKKLASLFTERQRGKIDEGYLKNKRGILSPAYKKIGRLALLPVKSITNIYKKTEVVSLETLNHFYITSWGILTHNCFPKDMAAFIEFIGYLIKNLETAGKKSKINSGLVNSLKNGKRVLESIHDYNKSLLKWQGLTIDEMSKHDKEIIVQKRKVIRV